MINIIYLNKYFWNLNHKINKRLKNVTLIKKKNFLMEFVICIIKKNYFLAYNLM